MKILLIRRGDVAIFPDCALCLNTLPTIPGVEFHQHVLDNQIEASPAQSSGPCYVPEPDVNLISHQEMIEGLKSRTYDLVFEQPFYNHRPGKISARARAWTEVLPYRVRHVAQESMSKWTEHIPLELLKNQRQVMIDSSDRQMLTPFEGWFILSGALYCKWDLPFDRSKLFFPKRTDAEMLKAVEAHLHYHPLGINDFHFQKMREFRNPDKEYDVFWAGNVNNTHRAEAVRRLEVLHKIGDLNVLLLTERVSEDEYLKLAAKSRVILSPEGQGWECWRHLEAFALDSVPYMNLPTADARAYHTFPRELFYENSYRDFESGLIALCNDAPLRQKLLTFGLQKIEEEFLWSRIMHRLLFEKIPDFFPDLAHKIETLKQAASAQD